MTGACLIVCEVLNDWSMLDCVWDIEWLILYRTLPLDCVSISATTAADNAVILSNDGADYWNKTTGCWEKCWELDIVIVSQQVLFFFFSQYNTPWSSTWQNFSMSQNSTQLSPIFHKEVIVSQQCISSSFDRNVHIFMALALTWHEQHTFLGLLSYKQLNSITHWYKQLYHLLTKTTELLSFTNKNNNFIIY